MAGSTGLEPATSGLTVFRRLHRAATESDYSSENQEFRRGDGISNRIALQRVAAQIPHTDQSIKSLLDEVEKLFDAGGWDFDGSKR